jgi:hypothetical protein
VTPKPLPSLGIEFTQNIIGQNDRRHPASLADRFQLGESKRQDKSALLALRSEFPGIPIFEQEAKIIAVGTLLGRSQLAVPEPAGSVDLQPILCAVCGDIGAVLKSRFLVSPGKL